jgi:hypothetical protein
MDGNDQSVMDPATAQGNAFVDALIGARSLLQTLDALVTELPRSTSTPLSGAEDCQIREEPSDLIVDALLGLFSCRVTFGYLFEALLADGCARPTVQTMEDPATWSREILR